MNPCSLEDFSDNEEIFAKEITKWSSNDMMDKIETAESEEAQGTRGIILTHLTRFRIAGDIAGGWCKAFFPMLWFCNA